MFLPLGRGTRHIYWPTRSCETLSRDLDLKYARLAMFYCTLHFMLLKLHLLIILKSIGKVPLVSSNTRSYHYQALRYTVTTEMLQAGL